VVTRSNRKTVIVNTDDGAEWNVSAVFLGNARNPRTHHAAGANVLLFGKR
jgi:hypothetical protein